MKESLYLLFLIFTLFSCKEKAINSINIDDHPVIYYYFDESGLIYYDERFTHSDSISKINREAKSLFFEGKRESAIEISKNILNENPVDPIVLNQLGIFFEEQKNFEKAIYYLNKSIKETDSLYSPSMINLGDLYATLGEQKKAEKIFNQIINNSPYDIKKGIAFEGLARMYYKYGYIEKAKKMMYFAKKYSKAYPRFTEEFSKLERIIYDYNK